jgi:hypothetical protein
MSNPRADLDVLLAQLVEARGVRLTARPGRVVVDHRDGSKALDIEWTEQRHAGAFAAVGEDVQAPGVSVRRVGDAIVLTRGPDANRRIDDLARDGLISPLAARFLDAAVATGRNVIVAGPWLSAADLVWALVAGAARPAVIDTSTLPLPGAWLRARDPWELNAYGADRTGVWARDVYELGHLMTQVSGLVGWADARRLERVLVRYEAAIDSATPQAQAPLQVVAGIDIVVIVRSSGQGTPARVNEIAEVTMSSEGYQPQLLFATGYAPSPSALVPLAAPSFVDELSQSGFSVLADELRAAAPRRAAPQVAPQAVVRHDEPDEIEEIAPEPYIHAPPPRYTREGQHRHDPLGLRDALRATNAQSAEAVPKAVVEALRHAPPPGWELDQAGGEQWADEAAAASNAEDAAMAAQFGLAPPPRPAGYKGETVSFTELLKRAKEREHLEAEQLPSPPDDT